MIATKKSQTIGPAIHRHTRVLLGERAGVRASYPSAKPLIKNHNVVPSFSPGLPRAAAATLGNTSHNPAANSEAARSAKLICGYPIRLIGPICPIPHRRPGCELLIKVENSLRTPLSSACHKPIIRPENKGIKPKSNCHKPKKIYHWLLRLVAIRDGGRDAVTA